MYEFKWIAWNLDKIALHNVTQDEAEYVVNHPFPGYPQHSRGVRVVWSQSAEGAYLQVAYIIEPDDCVFVIHARPLTESEKRRARRRRR